MRLFSALGAAAVLLLASAASAVSPYLLFFDPGSIRIKALDGRTLDNAAAAFLANDVRQIRIEGQTDRAGSAQSNRELSRRRAEVVRAALIARGYTGEVSIVAHGEEQPLVETEDGVSEAQNRRVAVIMVCIPNPSQGFEYMRCRQ